MAGSLAAVPHGIKWGLLCIFLTLGSTLMKPTSYGTLLISKADSNNIIVPTTVELVFLKNNFYQFLSKVVMQDIGF